MNTQNPDTLYRKLVENMNEAVWMGDEQERTVYANPKFCELMEMTLEEMLGKQSYEFWDEDSAKRVRQVNSTDRKRGISSSYEGTLVSKSGKRTPVLLSGTPLPGGGTIGIMTDLTALKKQESMYRKLVENMNEAVWMGDEQERTVYANPKFCELMEMTLEEMLGKQSYEFWDKESAKKVRQVNSTDRKRGISSCYEGTLVSKSGKRTPVLLSGTPLPSGGTIGMMTDLRELKKKEEKERVLSSAIMYGTDAVLSVDKKGNIQSWNKGAKMIFGYSQNEIEEKPLSTIFSTEDYEPLLSKSNIQYNIELTGKHKNAQDTVVSVTVCPIIHSEEKIPSAFILIARDITAQRKFEEEVMLKYQKIRDAYNKFGIIRRQMDYIFDLTLLYASTHDAKALGDFIVNSVIMLSRADACTLRLHDREKGNLGLLASFGVTGDWLGKSIVKYKDSLVEKAYEQGAPIKVIDIMKEPKYSSPHLAKKHNFCSVLIIPLTFRGELVGGLSLYVSPQKKLELFENDFIEKYALLIGIVLHSSRPPAPSASV